MFLDRNLKKYIVFAEDSILTALKKISDNKSRIIFSVTESGILEGVLSDGDFRRWLVTQSFIDLNLPVHTITNKNYKYIRENESLHQTSSLFPSHIEYIPVLDQFGHLIAIARNRPDSIQIGEFAINDTSPTFIIAEIGNNHNGSITLAKKLVDLAKEAGADCVKFQLRHMSALYRNAGDSNDASEDLGSQYTLDLLSRFQLKTHEMLEVFDYCRDQGILALCTPWDLESLSVLKDYGMPGYKVASADLTNHDFLKALSKTGKPLICSTGMSTEAEIIETIKLLQNLGAVYILLHCNSTYPAPFKDINLNYMNRLKELGDCVVGYSGHERDIFVSIAAVAKGAKVIEKHFTIDRSMEGNDHKVSLLPNEFKRMVEGIRQVEAALGSVSERKMSQGELINRETLAKSLVINCNLNIGETITSEMIEVKSPGKGLQPNRKSELIGKKAKREFKAGDYFFLSDLEEVTITPRRYKFTHRWGVPVRYHDFKQFLGKTNLDLLEFHLSYKDLEIDIRNYFSETYDLDFVVHSPELFSGDHIMDLCSPDETYRNRSIQELQKVVDITRQLKPYFLKSFKPLIVVNVGGFTLDSPLNQHDRERLYGLLTQSLEAIDSEGVEIIPQTMPPFPWHFGGQRFHNLFVAPKDIVQFCKQNNYRICLDISHSKLACNHYKWSFSDFIESVSPYAVHLHIADAKGVDGEGLQIGDGDIDFKAIFKYLKQHSPSVSFIPEVWQGHKNGGEGFWRALDLLEKIDLD